MPDRYVRDALLRSERWNALVDAETQNLFIRLLLLVDDFGCFDGREGVIATQAYPLNPMGEEEMDGVRRMLRELHLAELIIRYSNAGRPFIAIAQWGNDLRGSRRFPAPPVDIDLETIKVRGKFGQPIGWTNPPGFDQVSILLGIDGRAVSPQPDEWRPPEHLLPATKKKHGWQRATNSTATSSVQQAASSTPHVAGVPEVDIDMRLQSPDAGGGGGVVASPDSTPPATAASPPPPNGKIEWNSTSGALDGVSEAQRLRWQDTFLGISIPDQLDRMSVWLQANPAERQAIEALGLGFESFIARWLLKETREAARLDMTDKGAH